MKFIELKLRMNEQEQACFQFMRGCYSRANGTGLLADYPSEIVINDLTVNHLRDMVAVTQNLDEPLPEKISGSFPIFWEQLSVLVRTY